MNKENKKIIPIFFATDDNYVPYMSVAIKSLLENASDEYFYNIHILTEGLREDSVAKLEENMNENSRLIIDLMNNYIEKIENNLQMSLRDYYTISIFYRLFIAEMYPNYDKAIYLDGDLVVVGDIAKLYNIDLEGNILGGVVDDVINSNPKFIEYAREAVGIDDGKYFNSGMLLMDLKKYREEDILNKFLHLLTTYNFETAAPDQDYLNVLCKDKVKYLEKGWDRMSVDEDYDGELYIIHYNNFRKPWYYNDVPYQKYFWDYACKSNYYDEIMKIKNSFTEEMAQKHILGAEKLVEQTIRIVNSDNNFKKVVFGK